MKVLMWENRKFDFSKQMLCKTKIKLYEFDEDIVTSLFTFVSIKSSLELTLSPKMLCG